MRLLAKIAKKFRKEDYKTQYLYEKQRADTLERDYVGVISELKTLVDKRKVDINNRR